MAVSAKFWIALIVFALFVLFIWRPKWASAYTPNGVIGFTDGIPSASFESAMAPTTSVQLPREIASDEDFGVFSPEDVMKNQNYLDPRSHIGYPETLGGPLRNASYDLRSEPPNPRAPVSIWNNSTIVADTMRPQFEILRE